MAACIAGRRLAAGAHREPAVEPQPLRSAVTVSVVVPARNEAERIGPCVGALAAMSGIAEVIVIDDESTDDTATVAASFGARVVRGRPLAEGWVGKPWALQQGLEIATGEVVIFLDADTVPRSGLVGAAVEALLEDGRDVVSFAPRFICDSLMEMALHASMLATLVYRFGPVGARDRPSAERVIANGQCVAARRKWLLGEGGFALAAGNMTDDVALVRALVARGADVVFLDGYAVLDVRMHESVGEVWKEWGRSLPMVDVSEPLDRWTDIAAVWLVMVAPLLRVLSGRATWVDRLLLGVRWALCLPLRRSYRDASWGLAVSPFLDVAAALRLTQTTIRPVRTWRNRTY